jgi:hypothetical protein
VRFRINPKLPVAQNLQCSAHPTWVETQPSPTGDRDRFDLAAVGQSPQVLDRAVARGGSVCELQEPDAEPLRQPAAKRLRQVRHPLGRTDVAPPDRVLHLTCPERWRPEIGHEAGELRLSIGDGEVEQAEPLAGVAPRRKHHGG